MVYYKFESVGAYPNNPKWDNMIKREKELYHRKDDIRNEFMRDYNRILHCTAYRRLKHKTQVFFAPEHDHICTRMEHVNHVASVSYTIAKYLGLNTELTNAIALGHDLGHAPFGHEGEKVLKELAEKELGSTFWHEKNSLWFIDKLETLPNPNGEEENLLLTYAVRDGIVCHCGEIDQNGIFPRDEIIDLANMQRPGEYQPYTWEGCVVKIADKISFLGRDFEDAIMAKILTIGQLRELRRIMNKEFNINIYAINNTVLMHHFIVDLCKESSPQNGIKLSCNTLELIKRIREFNNRYIYNHPRLEMFKRYARVIIESIYYMLKDYYSGKDTVKRMENIKHSGLFTDLFGTFINWLIKYSDINLKRKEKMRYQNTIVYRIDSKDEYLKAVIDYISGMTDNFAIKIFKELTTF